MSPRPLFALSLVVFGLGFVLSSADQVPGAASAPAIPITSHDRVYLSDQSSNTVSVVDPASERLLGVLRLGNPTPGDLSPLYTGQLLVHGMGFSPDHHTLDVVSIGSNSVTFIDTATNTVKHVTYVGRAPHEAMFSPDGNEVWVAVRGENYIEVLDGHTYQSKLHVEVPNGPGMTIFSPDGHYAYVCSSFSPVTVVVDAHSHEIVGHVAQVSPFCPDIAATPDGTQVWETLKDTGKTEVFNARPPFPQIAVLQTGPITNHVNIVRNAHGQFAYVTIGGLNEVKVFTTSDQPALVATIPVGDLPHGLWPSGDGRRIYIGLENADAVTAIDTLTQRVVAVIPSGQSPQGMVYIPDAVPSGTGMEHLEPLGKAGAAVHLSLGKPGSHEPLSSVAVNDQGLTDLIEVAATGLQPHTAYLLALAPQSDGTGPLELLTQFQTSPSGTAVVSALAHLRGVLQPGEETSRRYLVIVTAPEGKAGAPVQVQLATPGGR
ncbi:MAG: YncE family protein [Terriglobales bacterium]